ncbi:pyridoxamine 5'-phosphate oxidase family protein [Lichenifustis flavocetrariae]|uniref:Pyridoxamine 5'-phosphate oxidase family protein n=1 Tax=Lichenifustis flavocetrariae TaxID=2949735 RepID=A0AA42CPD6_9HYPH|nr:pyridoxamine 5'-phosphate oxidase family protein [Lichenifustis flavocetrariae]MCW6510295.1 pyridoxamine 5'-phosphate oxidase family protein [Lichenifustis flavocetrariae]
MSSWTLSDIAKKMKDFDFCFLSTHSEGGTIAGRPMSNNGDVEYQGDSFFFTSDDTLTVKDIGRDPKVALSFQGPKSLLGKPGLMIAVEGQAELIRDKAAFKAHWTSDLERWFADGIDTPGLVLIKVHAARIHYWDGEQQGEVKV